MDVERGGKALQLKRRPKRPRGVADDDLGWLNKCEDLLGFGLCQAFINDVNSAWLACVLRCAMAWQVISFKGDRLVVAEPARKLFAAVPILKLCMGCRATTANCLSGHVVPP